MREITLKFIVVLILSCLPEVSAQETKNLQISKVQLSDQLLKIIQDSKKHFEKGYKTLPKYIKVEFFSGAKHGTIYIDNTINLYIDDDDQKFISEKFAGVYLIDNIYVLFKDSNLTYNNQFYKILSDKLNVEIINGGNINFSTNKYEIVGRKLVLKDSSYGFDIYVD